MPGLADSATEKPCPVACGSAGSDQTADDVLGRRCAPLVLPTWSGSPPGPTPAEAMATALDIVGPSYLQSLPDGETGERRNWVISIVDGLSRHPDLELKKAGDWSDYDKTPRAPGPQGLYFPHWVITHGYSLIAHYTLHIEFTSGTENSIIICALDLCSIYSLYQNIVPR